MFDTDTYDYIELYQFLKLLSVLTCMCRVQDFMNDYFMCLLSQHRILDALIRAPLHEK